MPDTNNTSPRMIRQNCPLCGISAQKSTPVSHSAVICNRCSLAYKTDLSHLASQNISDFYTFDSGVKQYDSLRMYYFEYFWKYITTLTKKSKGRLLDLGCGPGMTLQCSQSGGWEAEGIELSQAVCEHVQQSTGCQVHHGPLEKLNLPARHYDLILMTDVFRYFINPLKTLSLCSRILKDDGVIVIRELNYHHNYSKRRFADSKEFDLLCLTPKTAKQFLERIGIMNITFYPSPMSLTTLPVIKNMPGEIKKTAMSAFNRAVHMLYHLTLKRSLRITSEFLIIGVK
jgi:ubiquinone/menaquinone biosynthesis C-methylase UbiE